MSVFDQERTLNSVAAEYSPQHRRRRRARSGQKPTFGEPARMSGRDGKAQFSEGLDPRRCGQRKMVQQNAAHAVICKPAAAAAAAAGGLSCIERGPVREFPSAKSSESGFHSSRKRSNIVPRGMATDLP